jgi:DNA-binding protein H-NS
MAKTLAQLKVQIAKLQKQADALKAKEVAGVVERIKVAIAHYGLTPADLGFTGRTPKAGNKAAKVVATKMRKKAVKKSAGVVRYRDDAGNIWTGHGRRPKWFLAALEAGKKPESLEV